MGIGDKSYSVLESLFAEYDIKTVLELGAQQFYHTHPGVKYGDYAHNYYHLKGVSHYESVDICGDNNSLIIDLTQPISFIRKYDLVTDFGTSEHISSAFEAEPLYNCWTTKFNASKQFILSCNPSINHWPLHGKYFFTTEFYEKLAELTNTKIRKLQYQFAMGNYDTGREVICILEKTPDSTWISYEDFKLAFSHVYPL